MFATIAFLGILSPKAPAPFVCVNNQVIAVVQKQKWTAVPRTFGKGIGKIKLIEVGIGKIGASFSAKGVNPIPEIEGSFLRDPGIDVGVCCYGLKPAICRPASAADSKSCKPWVADWLKSQKVKPNQVGIYQAFQADLDGDGKNETIVETASRKALGKPESVDNPKDYSAVLVRAWNKTFAVQFEKGGLSGCAIKAIADFDGDGKMEIVSTSAYYEGFTATIHRFEDGKAKKLAENGSGA